VLPGAMPGASLLPSHRNIRFAARAAMKATVKQIGKVHSHASTMRPKTSQRTNLAPLDATTPTIDVLIVWVVGAGTPKPARPNKIDDAVNSAQKPSREVSWAIRKPTARIIL